MTRLALAHLLFLYPTLVAAQSAADTAGVPRTAWGTPDLQGVWDFRSIPHGHTTAKSSSSGTTVR